MSPNLVTERYIAICRRPGSRLSEIVHNSDDLQTLFVCAGQPLLNRPFFVPGNRVHSFAKDLTAIFRLLTSLPNRLFDGNMQRYCTALGIGPRQAGLMLRLPDRLPPLYGRADLYDDGERFWLLEFNIGSELGGIERAGEIPKAFLHSKDFTNFARAEGLGYVDTGSCVVEALRAAAAGIGVRANPVVALVDAPGSLAQYGAHWNSLRLVMQRLGLTFLVGEINGLTYQRGKPVLDGQPVDVVLRCFSVEEIAEEELGPEIIEPLMRAHQDGSAVVWTPMSSTLFANKGALALLHEPKYQKFFSADERDLIARVLPLTRSLRTDDPDALQALIGFAMEHQSELILKPNDAYGGRGIVPGWTVEPKVWCCAIRAAVASGRGWIIQQRIRPQPEPVLDAEADRSVSCEAVWGMYFTPDGYAGSYARVLPAGSALIGIGANAQTRTAGVFTFPAVRQTRAVTEVSYPFHTL
jgi:hypothetical protein